MIDYGIEELDDAWIIEASDLIDANIEEVSPWSNTETNVDWDGLMLYQSLGALALFTMRRDKELVGYAVFVIQPVPYSIKKLDARQFAIYVIPSLRGRNAVNFMIYIDVELEKRGKTLLQWSFPKGMAFSKCWNKWHINRSSKFMQRG